MSPTENTVRTNNSTAIAATREVEAVYLKIAKRIMPFLILLFVMAWMDRVNVGFAKLQMVKDLSFSEAVYGFGAGIFFLGYLLFEIPSNLFLEKIGARKTITAPIARIQKVSMYVNYRSRSFRRSRIVRQDYVQATPTDGASRRTSLATA